MVKCHIVYPDVIKLFINKTLLLSSLIKWYKYVLEYRTVTDIHNWLNEHTSQNPHDNISLLSWLCLAFHKHLTGLSEKRALFWSSITLMLWWQDHLAYSLAPVLLSFTLHSLRAIFLQSFLFPAWYSDSNKRAP